MGHSVDATKLKFEVLILNDYHSTYLRGSGKSLEKYMIGLTELF